MIVCKYVYIFRSFKENLECVLPKKMDGGTLKFMEVVLCQEMLDIHVTNASASISRDCLKYTNLMVKYLSLKF